MRTLTNNHGISMILLRTGTKSIMRFELCENSDQKVTSRADEIRVEDYNPRTQHHMMVERACCCA